MRLAASLNVSPYHALAHVIAAQLWAAEKSPDGSIPDELSDDEIAALSGYAAAGASHFAREFRRCCVENGVLVGWDYAGLPARQAARERERKAESRRARQAEDEQRAAAGKAPLRFDARPYADVWKATYGGEMFVPKHAKHLRVLELEYGHDEVLRRWTLMLQSEKHHYASGARLRQGWDTYSGNPLDAVPLKLRRARQFYDIVRAFGGLPEKLARATEQGIVKDSERFVELWRMCDREVIKNARTEHYVIEHIAERIGGAFNEW